MGKFSERKSPLYFHITAQGSARLEGEEQAGGNWRGPLPQTDSERWGGGRKGEVGEGSQQILEFLLGHQDGVSPPTTVGLISQ